MVASTIRNLHKWTAATTSVFLVTWLLSGIVMTVPVEWLARLAGQHAPSGPPPTATHLRDFEVSIPEALAALQAENSAPAEVRDVRATTFQGRPAYQFVLADGSVRLVDGVSGNSITLTQPLAERLAKEATPQPNRIKDARRLDRRDFFFWGALPAYKIIFEEPRGYVVYVSAAGETYRSTTLSRLHRWVTSLHGFEPITLIYRSERLRVGAVIIFSLLAVIVVVSGLYLVLPPRLRVPRVAKRRD